MKGIQILTALGEVNEQYIEEAEVLHKAVKRREWTKWAALAACMSLLLAGGVFYRVKQNGDEWGKPPVGSENLPIGSENLPIDFGDMSIGMSDGATDFIYSYDFFKECSIGGVRNLYGLPSELGQEEIGEYYMKVGVSSGYEYDYQTKYEQIADINVFEYASNPYGGIYILQKDDRYIPAIHCNVEGNGEAKWTFLGEGRPQGIVEVGEHVIFPKSDVLLISGSTAGTQMNLIPNAVWGDHTLTKEDLCEFLSLIESAEAVDSERAMNPNRKMVGCDMLLVLADDAGSQIGISLKAFDDGFTAMQIWYENEAYREEETLVFLRSEELVEWMKWLTNWKVIDLSALDSVASINCPFESGDVWTGEDVKRIVAGIKRSSREYVDTACPYDIEIWFHLGGDGIVRPFDDSVIRALWCNDSCGYLAIEGGVYRLTEEDAQYLSKLLED